MRKLIIANFTLAFLLIGVFILGYYFLQYPEDFDISSYIRHAEWVPFGLVFLGLIMGAFALSSLPIKSYNRKRKVAMFLAALQGLLLCVLLFKMFDTYKQNKNYLDFLIAEYREKANADIKKGFVEIEYAGGLELLNEKELKMRAVKDSVRKLHGFSYRNSGCLISASLVVAQEEYEKLTKAYLNKRNGHGWEHRMEKQIEEASNEYR